MRACACFISMYVCIWSSNAYKRILVYEMCLLVYEHACMCMSIEYHPSSIVVRCMKSIICIQIWHRGGLHRVTSTAGGYLYVRARLCFGQGREEK